MERDVPQCVAYRATCDDHGGFDYVNGSGETMSIKVTRWTPSIHMPRWASRITLEATADARLERLQDISEDDARAEGAELGPRPGATIDYVHSTARDAYAALWDEINGAVSWAANPEVVVLQFRRLA
jgi:hypothetical protein